MHASIIPNSGTRVLILFLRVNSMRIIYGRKEMESQLQIKKETMGYVKELREGMPDIFFAHVEFKEEIYRVRF